MVTKKERDSSLYLWQKIKTLCIEMEKDSPAIAIEDMVHSFEVRYGNVRDLLCRVFDCISCPLQRCNKGNSPWCEVRDFLTKKSRFSEKEKRDAIQACNDEIAAICVLKVEEQQ